MEAIHRKSDKDKKDLEFAQTCYDIHIAAERDASMNEMRNFQKQQIINSKKENRDIVVEID